MRTPTPTTTAPTSAIAVVSPQFIRVELEDEAGRTTQGVTVDAGKRLVFSKTRADGGLGLLGAHRISEWQRQDTEVWRAHIQLQAEEAQPTKA